MSVQSVSIGSMFSWIVDSFKLLKRNFGTLMAASALTLGLGLLMSVPIMYFAFSNMQAMAAAGVVNGGLPTGEVLTMFYVTYALTIVLSLVLFPPVLVGWFRLSRDVDQGRPVAATDILAPYRDSHAWLRSVVFALLAALLYLAVIGLFLAVFWGVIGEFMQQVAAQQAATLAGTTPPPPSFPGGILLAYFSFLAVAMFLQLIYMVGFGEVSLRDSSPLEAMKLAILGVFKNALKLALFLFLAFMLLGAVFGLVVVVLALVIGMLTLISPVVAVVVGLLLYIPFLLCMYPLMFIGGYLVWKSMLGGATGEPTTATESVVAA